MKTKNKKYVDGFVIPLKKKDVAAYRKMVVLTKIIYLVI